MDSKKQAEELVLTVKPGTKVKVVEAKGEGELKDRDVNLTAPHALKISVSRVHPRDINVSPSSITMCG